MNDTILIHGLECRCIIGVNPGERTRRQKLLIDIELEADLSAASRSDSIEDTVDYHGLAEAVKTAAENSSFFLIERFAGEITAVCLSVPRITAVTVTVKKPEALPSADYPAVRIRRTR